MRNARKFLLLALTALAAMAFGASSASADPVELVNELAGNAHCTNVTTNDHVVSGGCRGTARQEAGEQIELETDAFFGFHSHLADCDNLYNLNLNEDGKGYISGFQITNCSAGVTPCAENDTHTTTYPTHSPSLPAPSGILWPAAGEETATGVTTAYIAVCIQAPILGQCEGLFPVAIDGTPAAYEATATNAGIGSSDCEVNGHWTITDIAGQRVRINHL